MMSVTSLIGRSLGRRYVIGLLAVVAGVSHATNPIWVNPLTTGAPIGTYYLGDAFPQYISFEIGQASWNYAQVGVGTNSSGANYSWGVANWYQDNGGNKDVRRDMTGVRFINTGSWYVICQAKESSGDTYTSKSGAGWSNPTVYPPADLNGAYYTVNSLNNPSVTTATTNPAAASGEIKLAWSKDGQSHNVMIVRKASSSSWTEPTRGSSYSAGNSIGSGTVVYNGSDTAYTNTGLASDTSYDYKFYSENYSYYSAGVTANNIITLASEPTSPATGISFSGVSSSATTVSWSRGNGANVIVVCQAGSAPADPSDTVGYTADSTFGSGTAIGSGYVVYSGSGTSVSVSGLSAGTTYHYAVYEYNGANSTNYLTSSKLSGSKLTLSTEPTSSPTVSAFTAISGTGMTVNWSGGNGSSVIVLMKQGGAVDSNPVDGTSYTANSAFGSGSQIGVGNRVVYLGSASSVPVTGLTAGQSYTVAAYALNGSGGSENYLTSSSGTGGTNTPLTAPSSPASAITLTGVSPSGMTVGCTPGDGAYRLVVMRAGGAVNWTPTDNVDYSSGVNANFASATDQGATGSKIVSYGAATNVTVSGLSAATTYYVTVYEYNTNATLAAYYTAGAPTANQTTWSTEPTTAASTLSLTTVSKTGFTVGWANGNGASRMVLVKQGGAVNSFPADATGYTADATLGAGSQLGAGNYVVYSGSGSSVLVTGLTANTSYGVAVVEFNGSAGTANYKTNAFLAGTQTTLDNEAVILRSPATIDVTSVVGTAPSAQSFVVTNSGGSLLSYDLSTNAAWLSVNPVSGANLAANAGQSHTVSFNVSGLGAGTYNGTVTLTSTGAGQNAATNSPQTIAVSLTLTNITGVGSQSATASGKELVRLSWAGSGTMMVVHRAGAASSAPTQGTAYNQGDACGGGTVVYKGVGTSLEHVVAAGSVNNYAFYALNGNYYSVGVTASATTGSYGSSPTEVVEPFAYVTGASLDGKSGGNGFGGAWSESNAGAFTISGGSFGDMTGYPGNAANKVVVTPPGNGSRTATRALASTVSSGKLYVSFMLNFQYAGATKYTGLQFVDGSTEKAFFGEISSQDQQLGVSDGSTDTGSGFGLNASSGNDYLVVGMYDFDTQTLKVKGFYKTTAVPALEPSWDATKSASIGQITGIRLVSGAASGTPGDTYFDEIRVATNWAGLLNMAASVPAPTAASATASGAELVRLSWTPNGVLDVMVVASTGGGLTDPTPGQSYAVGAACGGGTVIYKGSATSCEHVVTPGSVNTYRFFSNNGSDLYSTGLTAVATAGTYGALERVEPFGYTNGAVLNGLNGGQGWSTAWSEGNSGSYVVNEGSFGAVSGYAANAGNKILVTPPADANRLAYRSFPAVNSGKLYVSFLMNYQFAGATKFAGVSFMNGGTEKAFFGEIGSADQILGLSDGSSDTASAFALNAGAGNDYVVVGLYDFGSGTLKVKGYWKGDTLPSSEPAVWDATFAVSIAQITGIRLGAGATSGTPGNTYFDEVRVATNWADVVNTLAPSTQAHDILFSGVTSREMVLSWSRGSGDGCLVVASQGAPLSTLPSDEVNYSANAAYGSGTALGNGFVVYKGTGTSVTMTGLEIGTDYYIRVFEFNGGQDAVRHMTSTGTGNPASQKTKIRGAVFTYR